MEKPIKRKWWIALLLTFFVGGSGYLYAGHSRRFVGWISVFALGALLIVVPGFWQTINSQAFLATIVLLQLVLFVMAFDSAIAAYRQHSFTPKWYNKWWIYLLIGLTLSSVTFLTTSKGVSAMRSYSMPAKSMAPTVMVGDYFLADPHVYENHKPERGDVVIFKLPSNPKIDYIKRIVGLPGDKVQFMGGQLYLNGIPVTQKKQENLLAVQSLKQARVLLEILPSGRSYKTLSLHENKIPGTDNTKIFLVPAGHYFVLGDNRDNSNDSRFPDGVGFVPQRNIYAKATIIYWANDLRRIGTLLNPR